MKKKKNILRFFTFLTILFVSIFSLSGFALALTVSQDVTAGVRDSGGGAGAGGGPGGPAPAPTPTPPPVPPPTTPPVTPPITPPFTPPVTPPVTPPLTPPVTPPVTPPAEIPGASIPPTTPGVFLGIIGGMINAITSPFSNFLQNTGPGQAISDASDIVVERASEFVNSPAGQVVTKTAKTVGIVSGAALVATQAILATATATIGSLGDIYLMLVRFSGLFFGVSRRRRKPWGTVYDSVTKRPLDPAYVIATKATGEEVADAITDLDGRYGFLIPSGSYKLKAAKTNYSFPTKKLENITHDEIYENIYHEEVLDMKEGDVIVKNIPLDPIGFDWNEFEKNKQNLFRIYSDRERFWSKVFNNFYLLGILSAIMVALFDPSPLNYSLLFVYLLFIAYQSFGQKHKAVSLKKQNGEPLPFAVVKVLIPEIDTKVKTAIADHLGRFYFLVAPGKYYLTIDQKNPDGTYTMIKKTDIIDLKNGVLSSDILV